MDLFSDVERSEGMNRCGTHILRKCADANFTFLVADANITSPVADANITFPVQTQIDLSRSYLLRP